MKKNYRLFIGLFICIAPLFASAQNELKLTCPFVKGTGKEPKEPFTWDPKDEKVIMVSFKDTVARSCVDGTVSNVNAAEEGNYEVVIYHDNYYFWYYGVAKPLVKKGDRVTARQAIAAYQPGAQLEFRMFQNEKAVDPRPYLECKIQKAN